MVYGRDSTLGSLTFICRSLGLDNVAQLVCSANGSTWETLTSDIHHEDFGYWSECRLEDNAACAQFVLWRGEVKAMANPLFARLFISREACVKLFNTGSLRPEHIWAR